MLEQFIHCYYCGGDYPPQFFARDRTHKNGKKSICRACESKRFRAWYAENRASVISRVVRNKERKQVIKAAGIDHSLGSRIDGKSPLRVFYELLQPQDDTTD